MLRRAIERVREERRRRHRRRWFAGLVAGVLLAAGALAGGLLIGQPELTEPVFSAASGDGVHLTARFLPAPGWTRFDVEVAGVSWGERCRLVVTDSAGVEHEAGSWAASEKATRFGGAVLVPLNEVRAISVRGHGDRELVRAGRA
ncbi:hypothetical protein [Amycolatopsis albispora]|uniref:Anti-sigma factor n=1 Tax=Amycolatopsis albispora TaxID=1804986 RepID=A0A344LFB7_9PSEU|nr:hypothetical protein [Amycolatopsis albispora]AXB46741.1 hypothetical protein A4R43_33435 [Amycolatopsis albispora]